jgi:hypothetical protein
MPSVGKTLSRPLRRKAAREARMAKKLTLTTGEKAIVDDADFEWASKHDWRRHHDGHVVRTGQPGEPAIVYLCNEVVSRANGVPLSLFAIPQ